VQRDWGKRDPYLVNVPKLSGGRQLDWRLAAALTVAMDAYLAAYY
jgi:hypothetical protein